MDELRVRVVTGHGLGSLGAIILLWMLLLPAWADISVTDDAGQPVVLDKSAQRIISLAPYITELLFAAGAGEAIVAVTAFSDYPEAAQSLTQVGDGGGLDLEAIIALQPDLVVAWQSGNPRGQVARLQSLGITVFFSEPRQLEDVPATLRRLGRLAGTESVAVAQADSFNRRYAELQERYAQRSKVSVFYQIWNQPLMTLNGEHLFSDVLRLCGGENVFKTLPTLAPQIDIEAVLLANPDVIVVAADDSDSPLLAAWQRWPQLSAVKQGHVYAMPRDQLVRHSPRILDGAERLCKLLDGVRR
ncbi:MAG TPA: cobalamin-binding protein [Gammaproteobacteria bacterium]|nr:cobalamin-binding protein [Gammaproteobacteria bacterium]